MVKIKKVPANALNAVIAFMKKVLGAPALSPECARDENGSIHNKCSWGLDRCECDCHDAESNQEAAEFLREFFGGAQS